jgi:hypothetical protein
MTLEWTIRRRADPRAHRRPATSHHIPATFACVSRRRLNLLLLNQIPFVLRGSVAIGICIGISQSASAEDNLRPLCPDRPGKATSACTVDAGYLQLESDVFNGSFQRTGGITTDVWFVTDPNLKFGMSNTFDVELDLAPLVLVRTHNSVTGRTKTLSGVGDLILRGKWAAIGNSGSDFALAIDPFLKLPTARAGIGNGAVEGGIVVPFSIALSDDWSVGTTPELDLLEDALGQGRHVNLVDVVSVGRSVTPDVTIGIEVWEDTNFEPVQTTQAWSFDAVGTWLADSDTQLDAGINFGLNRNTPGLQVYSGISRRF